MSTPNEQIKQLLINNLVQNQKMMVDFLSRLPLDKRLLDASLFNLDQSFMWAEKAILLMQLPDDSVVQAVVNEPEPVKAPEVIKEGPLVTSNEEDGA